MIYRVVEYLLYDIVDNIVKEVVLRVFEEELKDGGYYFLMNKLYFEIVVDYWLGGG